MRWFHKTRQPEVWETADAQPRGDIEAAQNIRQICTVAETIAEKMAALDGRNAQRRRAAETERYQAAIKRALEIAQKISDDSMRDVAVSQIMGVSVKAGHLKTAKVLLRAIRSERIRAELIAGNPALVDQ